jgi:acyl dehydratase
MEWLGEFNRSKPVDCTVTLGTVYPARRGVEFEMLTVMSQDELPCWQARTRMWSPKGPGGGEKRERIERLPVVSTQTTVLELPENLGRRYSAIAGDRNPIHQHALLARVFGFKQAIMHGMWTLARSLAEVESAAQKPARRVISHFLAPVSIPGQIVIESGALEAGSPANEAGAAHFGIHLSQGDRVCMIAQAEC